ncbi:MAG TPA: flagellar hook-length control protein FliK [Planctomycetota bacterium]
MVSPLLPAWGLARSLLPAVARLPESLLSGLGSLLGGASETTDRDPDFSGDDALVAQIAVQDPTVRAAVLREIDRRLSDDVPEDAATTARLERLRELLRRLEAEQAPPPAEPTGDVERDFSGEPELPPPSRAPTVAVAPVPAAPIARPADPPAAAVVVAKDLPDPVRAVGGAAAPPAPPASAAPAAAEAAGLANAELVDRILRASRLVQSRGISRLRLVLDPPELGEVRLDLSLRGNVVHGAFQADAPGAAEALGSRLSELKAALEKRGLRVGELSVSAAGADPAAPPANPFLASTSLPGNLDLKA